MLQMTAPLPLTLIDLLSPLCSVPRQDSLSADCEPNAAVLKCSHLAQQFTVCLIPACIRIELYLTSFAPLRLN